MKNHPYHLVDKSPWPILSSLSTLSVMSGMIMWFHMNQNKLLILSFLIMNLTMIQWWRDVIRESTFQGIHTKKVMLSMKIGMIMFICSEILFFASFFWAFMHSSLSPNIDIGMSWPPLSIKAFNPMNIPMLNTMILLSSGMSMTWAHNALINNNYSQTIQSIKITIILGVYFTIIQLYEYIEAPFSIADSIYGSTFFLSTGFHGIHVIIGTMFIMITLLRMIKLQMSSSHHIGFESSAWYWHFVDVVWLFLYLLIYWWGN
uniref:cytochrome c oxidase subunit 3 n=1 Tax=Nandigallia matai TaxID=1792639 RepID=UPI003001EAC2|nr:cytochrome c oxidase subunit 3 [Nandigallia matai]